MRFLLLPLQDTLRRAISALRAAVRRGAWFGAALLIASLACLFLLAAAFFGLRAWLGPGLAALILGVALLALAAGAMLVGRSIAPRSLEPSPIASPLLTPRSATPPRSADMATLTVFTTAFLLGRFLTERLGRSGNS
jgi:hypothetical protein